MKIRPALLAIICAIICATIGALPLRAAETTTPAQTSAPAESNSKKNPLAAVSLDTLSDTTERPLFASSRRKPPPEIVAEPVEAAPPPPPAPPKLSLYGIVQDEHGPRAIVKPGADDQTRGLRVGDQLESWAVTGINRTQLTLSLKERSVVFSLFDENGANAPPQMVRHHPARVIELNAAGVLTARRVGGPQQP